MRNLSIVSQHEMNEVWLDFYRCELKFIHLSYSTSIKSAQNFNKRFSDTGI